MLYPLPLPGSTSPLFASTVSSWSTQPQTSKPLNECLYCFFISAWGKSILSQLGKFFETGSFAIIYVYAAELYPTALRSTGMGMSSVMARVGSILAPVVGRELVQFYLKIRLC